MGRHLAGERRGLMLRLLLEHYLIQLLFTVGVVVLTGFTVAVTKRLLLKCCGSGAYCVEVVTGVIGTPIHETGHALMCLIFGHHINKMVLWQPRDPKGVLGYVSHSYNKKNLWHVLGNLFIGLGPIFSGLLVTLLMMFIGFGDAIGIYLDASADSVSPRTPLTV